MNTFFKTFVMINLLILSPLTLASDDFVGVIDAKTLHTNHEEFGEQYENYTLVETDVTLLKSIDNPITITALFGTWCHDSVREIPRLNKLLAAANNTNITTTLIAVDRKKTIDDSYKLQYTPTIIIYRDNNEIGRIIETPTKTIAQDIADIVSKH